MKKFSYCAYWRTWSRILHVENGSYVELNLTPINGFTSRTLDEVKLEVIRNHSTSRSAKDIETDELPEEVIDYMEDNLPIGLTQRLLNFDYLSEVSVEDVRFANSKSNGGGVPFDVIKKIVGGFRLSWKWE